MWGLSLFAAVYNKFCAQQRYLLRELSLQLGNGHGIVQASGISAFFKRQGYLQ